MKIFVFGGKNKNSQNVTVLQLLKIRQSVSAALPYSHCIISKKKKKKKKKIKHVSFSFLEGRNMPFSVPMSCFFQRAINY